MSPVLVPPTMDELSAHPYSDFHSRQNTTLDIIREQSDPTSSDDITSSDDAASSAGDDAVYDDTMSWRPRRKRGESVDGYEMRGQYYTAGTQTMISSDIERIQKTIGVEFDGEHLPPSGGRKTPVICRLSMRPIRRARSVRRAQAGKGRIIYGKPDYTDPQKVEAMMIYERGEVLVAPDQCDRCKNEKGISLECVVMPTENGVTIRDGACSNCLYQRNGPSCNARGRVVMRGSKRTPTRGQKRMPTRGPKRMPTRGLKRTLRRESKIRRKEKIQEISTSLEELTAHTKELKAAMDELLANGPDEGGHLSFARKKFSSIGKTCSVIQWGLGEEANSIRIN